MVLQAQRYSRPVGRRFCIAILPALVLALAGCLEETTQPTGSPTSAATTHHEGPSATTNHAGQNASHGGAHDRHGTHVWLGVVSEGLYPANPHFTLNLTQIPAGATVTVTYTNNDMNPLGKHDWYLDGFDDSQTDEIETGKETTSTFAGPTEPGVYTYYCTVPTHKDRGMVGQLTVT